MKYTPGPWQSHFTPFGIDILATHKPAGAIARIFEGSWSEEYIANAQLVRAAPELLEALTLLFRMCKGLDWCDTKESARRNQLVENALTKAKGDKYD